MQRAPDYAMSLDLEHTPEYTPSFDDLAAFQRTYLESQWRESQLQETGVRGEQRCEGCPSRREVAWSPLWTAWLCADCRTKRTEDELRSTRAVLGLEPIEPAVLEVQSGGVEMRIEVDSSEFLREIRDMRELILTLPDRRLEITGTFTDGAGNPLTATITGELMGLNDDAAPGD